MILDNEISIKPPAYSDNNNKIIQPDPIVLKQLSITYCDDDTRKVYYAKIDKIPSSVYLFSAKEYDSASPIDKTKGQEKLREILGQEPAKFLRSLFPKTIEENPNGPGAILSGMIKKIGIVMTQGCSCRRHAIEMNEKGNDWCEANIDTIVGWLREEASKRRLPFLDSVGKLMINRAIKKSRKLLANESVPENDEELDNL
jgi:hypothetical protein